MNALARREIESLPHVTPIVADRDALMILREANQRMRTFESFLNRLQISASHLEDKLSRLVEEGLLRPIGGEGQPGRYQYVLAPRGLLFLPIALSVLRLAPEQPENEPAPNECCVEPQGATVLDGIMICPDCDEFVARETIKRARGRPKRRTGR